jgi:16S rRNA (cytidine1402-2'-O)-methyltransferase
MSQGALYIVATPLGNLGDITTRARDSLAESDLICAEDTRRTRILLQHLGLTKPIKSVHRHNELKQLKGVLEVVDKGGKVVLVSDAGTPGISDPGARIVDEAHRQGLRVVPVPGPSAMAAALSVCGFVQHQSDILFLGFLPVQGAQRRTLLERMTHYAGLIVLFEAPHRAYKTLQDLCEHLGAREICVTRELTKHFEEVKRGPIKEMVGWAKEGVKGELTFVLGPAPQENKPNQLSPEADAALERCFSVGMTAKDAAKAVATVLELPKRQVYQRGLALRPTTDGQE